jgi:hypothetical protein
VRNPNQRSTWLIHDGPVGVKCRGEPRVFGQPVPDGGGLVGGEVVTDQVHVEFGGYGFVDGGEEFLELHRAVLAVQGGDHRAVGDVERGEQAARYRST